ncbi:RING-type E3 ubiquitin transferase [Sarracenia purpurea var. burkii]
MICQASPPSAAPPGSSLESYRKLFLYISGQIAFIVSMAIVFLVIVIAIVLFVYGLIFGLRLVWWRIATVLRRFGWIDRTVQALEERKNKEVLKNLPPVVKYGGSGCGGDGTPSSCAACVICLEDFKDGDLCQILPSCHHAFHSSCVKRWLINNQTCPNCRSPITGGQSN